MPRGIPNRKNDKLIADVIGKREPIPAESAPANLTPLPPPTPEPPSPIVIALQEQILSLVNQRKVEQEYLANANGSLRQAQAAAESARERLQMVEGEVQYRLGLIAQLQGNLAMQGWASPAAFPNSTQPNPTPDYGYLQQERPTSLPFDLSRVPQTGMGSIPAQRAPMPGVVGEVRQESAEDERRAM